MSGGSDLRIRQHVGEADLHAGKASAAAAVARDSAIGVSTEPVWAVGMYTSPVFGLSDMGLKLWPPTPEGNTSRGLPSP